MYRKRRSRKSGFERYCKAQLKSVKSASRAGTRSKAALRYQKCLASKGIKSGYKGKQKEKK